MRKALCLIFFLVFASSSWGAQNTPAVPELPRLSLDNFSPGIQEQIGEAYSYVRSHPGDAAASGRLGMVLQTYGLLQEAAVCYRRAGQLEPNVLQWAYYLGVVEADQGRCDAATSTLRLALQINAGYLPTKLRLTNCLHASVAWEASRKHYAEIAAQRPDNADAYYGLGRARAARPHPCAAAPAHHKPGRRSLPPCTFPAIAAL